MSAAAASERASIPGGRRLAGLGVVMAGVLLVYANSLRADFVFDARALILENPALRQASLANVRRLVTSDYWQPLGTDGLYRPLTTLSYLFNYAVLGNGVRPFGYHAVNLLLHLACTGLVYALLRALAAGAGVALLAAAVFGLHPVATEAVTNVVGRADLLAALGVVGGLRCHIGMTRSARRERWRWGAGLFAAALVAVFSKESGLVLVPVVLLYDAVFRARGAFWRPAALVWREHLVLVLPLALYLAARWAVARAGLPPDDISPVDNPIVEAGFWSGRLTAVKVVGRQLALLAWPRTLSADYSFAQVPVVQLPPGTWQDWQPALALVAVGLLAGGALRVRRTAPALCFLVLYVLVALLPTANLLIVIGSIMADRFLYLPLVGSAGAAALVVHRLAAGAPARRAAVGTVVAVALLAGGWRTVVRNRDWRDEPTFWASTVRTAPTSAKAHKGWAAAVFAADPERRAIDRVIAAAERAVAIRGDYVQARIDLGSYHLVKGDLVGGEDATAWYARSVAVLEPARILDAAADRRFAEKMVATGRAARGIPRTGHLELYQNLSLAYVRLGRFTDALTAYEHALRLGPSDPTRYVDVSAALCHLGRWEEAAVTLFQALTVRPDHEDAAGRLVEVYRTFDPNGRQVVVESSGRATVDLDDPVVRRHRCEALRGLARIFTEANQPDAAARVGALHGRLCRDG